MMSNRHFCSVAVAALLVITAPLAGAESPTQIPEDVVQLDPAHTVVDFLLPGYLHTTHGHFAMKNGTILIDPTTGKARGEVIIDAASENSSEALRDAITRHAVLEVDRYPEIILLIQRIQGVRGSQDDFYGQLVGLMKLHGTVHPITIWTHGHLIGDQFTAACEFLVPYTDWGVTSPNLLSPSEIVDSIHESDSGLTVRIFPVFAYMLPLLRKIPPNVFRVSDLIDVKVETRGRVTWAMEPEARKVTVIVPPQ